MDYFDEGIDFREWLNAGAISKTDLKRFLQWGAEHLGYGTLKEIEGAAPTAELEPIREGVAPQLDEVDMGMTYEELSVYGRLRKLARCGPVSMLRRLLCMWRDRFALLALLNSHVLCQIAMFQF